MPVVIPEDIPAFDLLKEHAFVIGQKRALHQDIRALEVLIINLMPTKIETENQLLSLLANSPLQVNITFLNMKSYEGKHTPKSHLERFYVNFKAIKNIKFDGAIVTGAPIEHLDFEDVAYWSELKDIMHFLQASCTSSIYICWGALAGLYHFYGIKKIKLDKKLSGVFAHTIIEKDILLSGVDDVIHMPHSRYYGINEADVKSNKKLKVLLRGVDSGISMLRDRKNLYILSHPEYTKDVLGCEYRRDIDRGLEIDAPLNYFQANGEIICNWRANANLIFANWLNFMVYQITPFHL